MTQSDTVELSTVNSTPFDIEEVQLQFNLQSEIRKLFVRNNIVTLVLLSGIVYRIDLESPEDVVSVKLTMHKDSIVEDAWIDSNSFHLIIKSSKYEYFYVHHESKTYQTLPKLKNINVLSSCFFDSCTGSQYTGPILIATSNGLLLEYAIAKGKEMICKTIMKNKLVIKAIEKVLIESDNQGILKYVISLFFSDNTISNIMLKIPSRPSSSVSVFQNLAKSPSTVIETGNVILVSKFHNLLGYSEASEILIADMKNTKDLTKNILRLPLLAGIKDFIVTKYFVIVLTEDMVLEIFTQLDLKPISKLSLKTLNEKIQGLSYDAISDTYWLHSDQALFELIIDIQNSGVIESLLLHNFYDDALALLPQNEPNKAKRNSILRQKGYHQLHLNDYEGAIETFLNTDELFEKIALQLFELSDRSILRKYLVRKLESVSKTQKLQRYLLSSWIVESYVGDLNDNDNRVLKPANHSLTVVQENGINSSDESSIQKRKDLLLAEFQNFLTRNIDSINKDTVYQIMISYNRSQDMIFFAKLVEDYRAVLNYFLVHQNWDGALSILIEQQNPELIYNSSTVLLVNHASATVETWMRLIDDLDPLKLISALITYNKVVAAPQGVKPEENQSLRFLRFLIFEKSLKNRVIHNLFFSTLISYPHLMDENIILMYLEQFQNTKSGYNTKGKQVLFDHDFILRLCLKFDKVKSAVFIYTLLEKYEEAVNLALSNGMTQNAIWVADKLVVVDDLQRKHLWIKIAKSFIVDMSSDKSFTSKHPEIFGSELSGGKIDNEVYALLKYLTDKCELLNIKDLLPFFPDFLVIDNFKKALLESLEKLSLKMNKTADEMESTLEKSDVITEKIQNFEAKKFQVISPYDSCEMCHKILTIRKFMVFPCTHAFHQDCMVKYILDSNDYKSKTAIYKLQKKISMGSKNSKVLHELKREIDELLSKSCILCSDTKINELDEPLIKPGDKSQTLWDI